MDFFVLLKFASNLVLPPVSTAVGVLIGVLLLAAGFRRTGKTLFVLSALQGIVFSLPSVADLLMGPLEREARAAARSAEQCCYSYIVVLGGAIPTPRAEMISFHLTEAGDRIVYAAKLYHDQIAPRVVVSGGAVFAAPSGGTEAKAMADMLVLLGVPREAILVEDRSRNTLDNISFVHRLVHDERVALVTSGYHMPRAMKIAREAGLNASAFPADWQIPARYWPAWERWLPTVEAERQSFNALREYLALALDFRRPATLQEKADGSK
ncbi:MAG TPA: YdcF family protein [Reyranella sp.]|nr:YdcF family protein [Reyranella sp.]